MSKLNSLDYFKAIEEISEYALSSVKCVCNAQAMGFADKCNPPDLLDRTDARICELEDKLFTDFLPPLERGGIAALAHSLRRVISVSSDIYTLTRTSKTTGTSKERTLCVLLAYSLQSN